MNLRSLFHRGKNLLQVGKAVQAIKNADGEEAYQRAQNYLMETLGKSRGLPTKIGQFMTLETGDLRETLNSSIPPMPFDHVTGILEKAYQAPWRKIFSKLDEQGQTASLGQVHFGALHDGTRVAVKVQYPEIENAVDSEMKMMGWLPKVGPVAKWGFQMEGYRDAFWNNFNEELNYLREAESQARYRTLAAPVNDLIVPEVFPDLCRPTVLVQRLEEGISLDKAETQSLTQRQSMGRVLLEHYLVMLFRHGVVHADPHPGNFAFRQIARDKFSVVLYDYGSILNISDEVRLTLLRIILALQAREPVDPVSCLMGIGFDAEKLQDLRPTLPALLHILFEPFVVDAPFDVSEWNMNERFDLIAGEMKWWFRSAAPPDLIFLMRTLHGMSVLLKRLGSKLPWKWRLEELCGDQFSQARAVRLPQAPGATGFNPGLNGIAKYLKVSVVKPNGNKVKLTMPARVAEDIKLIIDPPVQEAIDRQRIDLGAIQRRVRESGFVPQTLFDLKDPERDVRVWLE